MTASEPIYVPPPSPELDMLYKMLKRVCFDNEEEYLLRSIEHTGVQTLKAWKALLDRLLEHESPEVILGVSSPLWTFVEHGSGYNIQNDAEARTLLKKLSNLIRAQLERDKHA